MIITRKKKVPVHWLFYAQLPLLLTIYGESVIHAPFLLLMKKFMDNPAAIMGLISMEIYINVLGAPFISWLSDRVWTIWGRRKFFIVIADTGRALCLLAMPFAPNVIVLIILRWFYSFAGSFGSMTQALIYEVVPAPQRGRLSGFFQASVQFGNLVFFFLLLGRFDDYYFMGPFRHFTDLSGGALMFWLCALVLLGVAAFEALGFREIKPPDGKTFNEGRKQGQSLLSHFIKSLYKDIFAKDLLPVYLVVFANAMFAVSLGIFQPLLFTEQWGYSLQDMGNTIAVGAVFSIIFALFAGWFADRFGKIQTFVLASAGSLLTNIFYTVFVSYLPDNRPTLLQIIVIGTIGHAFMLSKSVVAFPLMMEYVKRNRMGSASAGIFLFQNLFRSLALLLVGAWLTWWSLWFLPQAGYQIAATFPQEIDETNLRAKMENSGLQADEFLLHPIFQYGSAGDTSMRWRIHRNDERSAEMLGELKTLKNQLSSLEAKATSPFISNTEKALLQTKISEAKDQTHLVKEQLNSDKIELYQSFYKALHETLFEAGAQMQDAHYENDTLQLTITTIEAFPPEQIELFERNLNGPQYQVSSSDNVHKNYHWKSDVSVEIEQGSTPRLIITAAFDPVFIELYRQLSAKNATPEVFELAISISSIIQSELGRGNHKRSISSAQWQERDHSTNLLFDVRTNETISKLDLTLLSEALSHEPNINQVNIQSLENGSYRLKLELNPQFLSSDDSDWNQKARAAEIKDRFATLLPNEPVAQNVATETYLRITDILASQPFYISVPENTPQSSYRDREFEYFFSSKTLEIASDIIGFTLILFILYIEKKGVIRRYGAEEDLTR